MALREVRAMNRFCVDCQRYIDLPVRRPMAFYHNHIRTEHPETWARQQAVKQEIEGVRA